MLCALSHVERRKPLCCRPEHDRFLLDDKELAPSTWAVNLAHEADQLGVPHAIHDRDNAAVEKMLPAAQGEEAEGAEQADDALIQGTEAAKLLEELEASVTARTEAAEMTGQLRQERGETGDMLLDEYEPSVGNK